jgi:MFS transporter, UMF1 family
MQEILVAPQLNNPRTVRAWYMYDWANSVYALVITTAIFPIYYKAMAAEGGSDVVDFLGVRIASSVLYSYALSFSSLIVALILPLLSGVSDYSGQKKSFMKFFVFLGSLACMGLYFFKGIETLYWGIFCSVVASIGYSGSLVFYDAFLPEIVTPDRYDRTSAQGYSMGYYGSVLVMVACLIMIMNPMSFGFSGSPKEAGLNATRFSFLIVGVWWIGFSMIPFALLPENPYGQKPKGNIWTKGYQEIRKVWQSLHAQKDLKKFLLAFFFYNMGVQTVMYLATLFGTDVLHLEEGKLIATLVIINLVGALGAWTFSRISGKMGNRFALSTMIIIWVGVCISAYLISNEYQFYALGFVVGMIMGGIQSLSRATYSKLIPANTIDHASYFSFYDVTYNVSIVIGTFVYGFVNQITNDMRNSALALVVFFVLGLYFLMQVKAEAILRPVTASTEGV